MPLKIRLSRIGRNKKAVYHIVVASAHSKRSNKGNEVVGFYDPTSNPPLIKIDQNKYQKWLKFGAQPSDGVRKILNEKVA